MKSLFAVCLIILLSSSVLHAQGDSLTAALPGQWEIQYSGGVALPYFPASFRESYSAGYNAGIGAGYSFSPGAKGYVAVYGSINYVNIPFDQAGFRKNNQLNAGNTVIHGGAMEMLALMMNVRGAFSPTRKSVAPYFAIGIGVVNVSEIPVNVTGDVTLNVPERSEKVVTWNAGLGIEVPVSDVVTLFVDGRFALAVTSNHSTQYFPLSAGIRLKI